MNGDNVLVIVVAIVAIVAIGSLVLNARTETAANQASLTGQAFKAAGTSRNTVEQPKGQSNTDPLAEFRRGLVMNEKPDSYTMFNLLVQAYDRLLEQSQNGAPVPIVTNPFEPSDNAEASNG